MKISKVIKDWLFKAYLGKGTVPKGLDDLHRYFANYGGINFEDHNEDGVIVSVSQNFHYGSIITQAKNIKELEEKIKDAILTAFGVPSSFAKEASICKVGKEVKVYAAA